jgi:aromatic ring-opening dioxygenase catalytic subunit (LigB family)
MTVVFAAALGHAPGITAWREAAPAVQRDRIEAAFGELRQSLARARPEALIVFTAEHWANFFLDHMSPYCIGRAPSFSGPIEPWLRIERVTVPGHPQLASELLNALYARDIEPGFTDEMALDHGTMVPLHFITPETDVPIVPVVFNTLALPLPSPRRSFALGEITGEVARASALRIGIVATGGMSHDPGERQHGRIDQAFDQAFLDQMRSGNSDRLKQYTISELAAAGAGALELVTWIALAGALKGAPGQVLAYEAVVPWATGIGAMSFQIA